MASPADSFSADSSATSPAAASADAQRQTIYRFYADTPAAVRVLRGPAHHYEYVNAAYQRRLPGRPLLGLLVAERQPTAVVFMVQDNGLGLSASQQDHLFQAFQRLHTHVEGTGVGRYMIKRLIENAGARIAVASQPGEGATFTATFPS